jgi:hypothetical protein
MVFNKTPDLARGENQAAEKIVADFQRRYGADSRGPASFRICGHLNEFELNAGLVRGKLSEDTADIQAARAEDGPIKFDFHGRLILYRDDFILNPFTAFVQ